MADGVWNVYPLRKEIYRMIIGALLLYVGVKLHFPALFIVGCVVLILMKLIPFVLGFMDGWYNGKS